RRHHRAPTHRIQHRHPENRGGTHSNGRITTALTFASPREGGDRTGEEALLAAVAIDDEWRSEAME
ncbi:Hypothetical predicted protein, partial [Olea europaea subsp. europaea]